MQVIMDCQRLFLVIVSSCHYYGLLHKFDNSTARPIACASKLIPKSELHHTKLDEEAEEQLYSASGNSTNMYTAMKLFYEFIMQP